VDRNNKEMIRKAVILQKSIASFTVIINTSSQVLLMVIIASCAMAIINDWMAVGTLVLFMAYINQVTNSIRSLIEQFPQITQFNESIHSIREILDYPAHDHNENAITMDAVKGDLSLKNVCFQYDQDRSVLENINLQVQKGETIALVGPSGSGKSTMINLILGLYLPVRGEITVDGYNLKKINLRQYRQSVGVVTQDPILFKGTLRENLCHGREFPDEQIIDASKLANAWEFIGLLPLGLDTIIGEDGVNLSGGQKQRIAITRAILRNPSILILDEATSALDSHSENEVQKGIEALIGRQTTFVIAHRLRTIYKADKILVFDKQGIAEEGNHSELIEMNGIYSEMVKLQSIQ
jgi:ABC-type multidrug transport system fused ATPase/permease subunit